MTPWKAGCAYEIQRHARNRCMVTDILKTILIMTPIDPKEPASPDPKSPMAPPYVDENPNLASVEDGLEVAENEAREMVADAYEATAKEEGNEEELLDSQELTDDSPAQGAPETSAIHDRDA